MDDAYWDAVVFFGWMKIHKSNGLVTSGIYKYMRHPQYTGLIKANPRRNYKYHLCYRIASMQGLQLYLGEEKN
jgi:hypothetical protein